MNQKGVLTTWNDAKGFGFITPEGGGERVFAHIRSFAGRGRPVSNRKVVYRVVRDGQGRPRAGVSNTRELPESAPTWRQGYG